MTDTEILVSGLDCVDKPFTWEVKNFEYLIDGEKELVEAQIVKFVVSVGEPRLIPTEWRVYLTVDTVEGKEWIGIFHRLDIKPKLKSKIYSTLKLTIGTSNDDCSFWNETTPMSSMSSPIKSGWGWKKFVERDANRTKSSPPLVNGSLVIRGLLKVFTERPESRNGSVHLDVAMLDASTNFVKEIKTFCGRRTGVFGAVKLVSGDGKEYYSNKSILSARSPVFATMFNTDMVEKEASTVTIPDASGTALAVMLRYIHCGEFMMKGLSTSEEVESVAYVAEKYELTELRKFCDQRMTLLWDKFRAYDALEVAEKLGLTNTKELIEQFLSECGGQVPTRNAKKRQKLG